MATEILMRNPTSGIVKKGFYGFSWTVFFFGFFVPFCRGDSKSGLIMLLLCWMPIIQLILSFKYNKMYTLKLVDQGYEFAGSDAENTMAMSSLGISKQTNKSKGE